MMFVTDFWVDSTNDFIDYMDNELLFVIKNSYETAINLNKACEGLDRNTKEAARLKEKARLLEFRKEIEGFRWNIAKLAYNSKRETVLCITEAIFLITVCFLKTPIVIIAGVLVFLVGLASLIMTYVCIKRYGDLIVLACSQYGIIKANIKVFDYRELETIDLERLPFRKIKYSREDLIGS